MNQCYPNTFLYPVLIVLSLFHQNISQAQCTCSDGSPAFTEVRSTSIIFSSNSTKLITMPQFNPSTGMLVCVNAKIYLTSVVRLALENDELFAVNYTAYYNRKDTFTGPGIATPIVGAVNKSYGPYSLGASNGSYQGPDYVAIGPDTVYNKLLYQLNTTNTVNYLGAGTVDFLYKSAVTPYALGSDYYLLGVSSKNVLDFQLTYSYCSTIILKSNIRNFQVRKISGDDVSLSWIALNESKINNYEIQVSEDATSFQNVGSTSTGSASGTETKYEYQYHPDKPAGRKSYFRIKHGSGTAARYSEIKALYPDGSATDLRIYPNPVVRTINMELNEPVSGNLTVELISLTGQVLQTNKIFASNNITLQMNVVNTPPAGFYYIRARHEGSKKVYSGKVLFAR
ncbi:MAG TPA: choice-of-anchor E domain-containing protein [Flavitalea sp.]|nr:choice-of-anchor E domain-containing protein [Flavitalea sp.]